MKTISGNIVDALNSETYPGTLKVSNGKIVDITRDRSHYDIFIIPGLIDAHVHIESSMLTPSEFARLAVIHGTVATVSDPHEIANVLGIDGVDYMIEDGQKVPLKFYFGAPSCVPATNFETAGAELGPEAVEMLLKRDEIKFLSEVMNYPGVVYQDPEVLAKIALAKKYKKRIDGHAPGVKGEMLEKYVKAGIETDHETIEKDEALQKLKLGMKLHIREGSAAKNFDTLSFAIDEYNDMSMLCSDDKHPDDLVMGQINALAKRALALGFDKMKVLKCACVNPVRHYGLDVGLLQKGDWADFLVIDNFEDFNILATYINGVKVAERGKTLLPRVPSRVVNDFRAREKQTSDFKVQTTGEIINVIEAIDGQVMTGRNRQKPRVENGFAVSDPERDILKLAVVNRYQDVPPAIGFVKNFGLKKGAISASVAHDSHNVVAVGVSDEDICRAVNRVIENKGGLAVVHDDLVETLALPVAGLMSNKDGFEVAKAYAHLDGRAKALGATLKAPFMTLSFMALLVIPELKLSDKGLFDGQRFEFVDLFEPE
ncbi:MAG: adenine deaminase [Thermodesulfobacteriota bacterium]|nr:adenine deaminase [Thermodesulfobacteriota bacterium]